MQDIKMRERESLEIVDQTQTPRYVSRFEPLLYVPAFKQKNFHYNVHTGHPTQGTSTEDLGNTTLEYTIPLSNNHNLYTRGKALSHTRSTSQQRDRYKANTITSNQRDRHKAKTPTSHSILRGIPTKPNSSTITPTQEGYSQIKEGYNSWWSH